jgi:hypothetical protein
MEIPSPLELAKHLVSSSLEVGKAWSCNPMMDDACIATTGGSKSILFHVNFQLVYARIGHGNTTNPKGCQVIGKVGFIASKWEFCTINSISWCDMGGQSSFWNFIELFWQIFEARNGILDLMVKCQRPKKGCAPPRPPRMAAWTHWVCKLLPTPQGPHGGLPQGNPCGEGAP